MNSAPATDTTSPRTFSAAIASGRVEDVSLDQFLVMLAENDAVTVLRPRCQAFHTIRGEVNVYGTGLAYFVAECCNPRTGYTTTMACDVNGYRRPVFDFYNLGRLVRVASYR